MDNIEIYKALKKTKCNKIFAIIGVLLALVLSCVIIIIGLNDDKSGTAKQRLDKSIEAITNTPPSDTACCAWHHKTKSIPIEITEKDYNNTDNTILYISILAFILLSLCGTFTVLLKVLKSENDINSKILDIQKDIYKEKQMWELMKEKKQQESKELILQGPKYQELIFNTIKNEFLQEPKYQELIFNMIKNEFEKKYNEEQKNNNEKNGQNNQDKKI